MKAATAAFLVSCAAFGQTLSIEAAGSGSAARVLRVDAAEAPALDLLARAAATFSVPLRIDPALLDDLSRRTISVHRDQVMLDDLVLLAGAKLGVDVRVRNGAIAVAPDPKTHASAIASALEHVDQALIGHPDPQLAVTLRFQRACLLLETGASEEAVPAFSDLARDFPGHAAASEARVLALVAGLRAGRPKEALGMLAAIEESNDPVPAIPGAELLPARVEAAAGDEQAALVRARKVAAAGRFERDRLVATLLAAEIQGRIGDGAAMLGTLRGLPSGFAHAHPDLAPLRSLATGAALRLLHDEKAALVHLRIAFRTVSPERRAGIALAIAECFAALRHAVPAWTALCEAEALESDPAAVRRIQARRAEIEESFGALGHATETCIGILKRAPGPFEGADRVLATLARCLLATDRLDDARTTLEALADREAYRGWAIFEHASLERRSGDPERALRVLARLRPADLKPPGPSPDVVRTLRGDLLLEIGDPLQAAEVFRGAKEEANK